MLKSIISVDVTCNGAKWIGFNSLSNSDADGNGVSDGAGIKESIDVAETSNVNADDVEDSDDADESLEASSIDVDEFSSGFKASGNGSCIEHANIKASIRDVSSS